MMGKNVTMLNLIKSCKIDGLSMQNPPVLSPGNGSLPVQNAAREMSSGIAVQSRLENVGFDGKKPREQKVEVFSCARYTIVTIIP
jgi:hypothetical protein